MRFKGTTPSSKDKDIPVYNFSIGTQELIIFRDLLDEAWKNTPRSLLTQPFTSRVDSMRKEVNRLVQSENIHIPSRSERKEFQAELRDKNNEVF